MTSNKTFPFEYAHGATPLDPNEINGLIPNYISTQGELNQLEEDNILSAKVWIGRSKVANILNETFLRRLHKEMFKNVWKWAGTYRTSDKSIGVFWQHITVEIKKLIEDTLFWIENNTYEWNELGARFHHRLVFIHPFPNGNGRHARLMTDILLESYEVKAFSWGESLGNSKLGTEGEARKEYIESLREADQKKFSRLIKFVRD